MAYYGNVFNQICIYVFVITMNWHLNLYFSYKGACPGTSVAMDHSNYVYCLNGFGIFRALMILLFKPKFNREAANQVQAEMGDGKMKRKEFLN